MGLPVSPDGKLLVTEDPDSKIKVWEVRTGKELWRFKGHESRLTWLTFSPDGTALATASMDDTVITWDLTGLRVGPQPQSRLLSDRRFERAWDDLGSEDGARAWRALWALAADTGRTPARLRKRVLPVTEASPQRIASWINDLGSRSFSVRQRATQALEREPSALPALRELLRKDSPLETRRRAEALSEKLEAWPGDDAAALRAYRGLKVLEQIGTPEAVEVLRTLARGQYDVRLREEALASLKRLLSRPEGHPVK
jgi:hypothetical protein